MMFDYILMWVGVLAWAVIIVVIVVDLIIRCVEGIKNRKK